MYQLFHGDCLEVMDKLIEDGVKADMILTDPPFGTTSCKWDSVIDFNEIWKRAEKLITEKGCICLFGTEPFSSHLRLSNEKMYKYDIKWIKDKPTNFINCNNAPMRLHENISVFSFGMTANGSKKNMKYYPQGLIEVNRKVSDAKNKDGDTLGYRPSRANHNGHVQKYTNYPTDVIYYSNKIKDRLHPTQKPVDLLEYLIKTYTIEGDTVLDFTMGSGSTGDACMNTNRKFIGIELDEKYFNIAKNRIENSLTNKVINT